jgi:Spy/CpxP family protein refolding chaperone
MKSRSSVVLAAFVVLAFVGIAASAPAPSPYVGQLGSSVRGLSQEEVDGLLNGLGLGYARMAEVNGYPGPLHVLQLRQELGLSDDQAARVQAVFAQMQADAKRLGAIILDRERELSAGFADRTMTEAALRARVDGLAVSYGHLRAAHLRAHLATAALLSAEQIAKYNQLRGYGGGDQPSPPHTHPGH